MRLARAGSLDAQSLSTSLGFVFAGSLAFFVICISQFGFVNKVLLPCVADEAVCENMKFSELASKAMYGI